MTNSAKGVAEIGRDERRHRGRQVGRVAHEMDARELWIVLRGNRRRNLLAQRFGLQRRMQFADQRDRWPEKTQVQWGAAT